MNHVFLLKLIKWRNINSWAIHEDKEHKLLRDWSFLLRYLDLSTLKPKHSHLFSLLSEPISCFILWLDLANETICWNFMMIRSVYNCSRGLFPRAIIKWNLTCKIVMSQDFLKIKNSKTVGMKILFFLLPLSLTNSPSHSSKDALNQSLSFFIFLLLFNGSIAIIWCKWQRASPAF